MSRSDPTDFVIEILEGPFAGQLITLTGREMPYRSAGGGSIEFSGELNVKTTWYPGNPIASQQRLGRKLNPTTINGQWKEHFIGVDRPITLVERFESLRDSGVQLLVSWSTVIRTGVLQKFVWKPGVPTGGLSDIGWEATFAWNGDGVPRPPPSAFTSPFDAVTSIARVVGSVQTLSGAIEALVDIGKSISVGGSSPMFDAEMPEINEATLAAVEAATRVEAAMKQAATLAEVDRTIAALAIADGEKAAQEAVQVADLVAALSIGALTGSDDADVVVLAQYAKSDVMEASNDVASRCIGFRDQVELVVRAPVARRVPAVEGTDLRQYASKYYGNPDVWVALAEANGLWDSLVPAGVDEIIIPERLDGTASDRRFSGA